MHLTRSSNGSTDVFGTRFCNEARLPPFASGQFGYYADFDGDGYADRVRISLSIAAGAPHGQAWLALGARGGPADERPWFNFAAKVVHHMIEFLPAHGRHALLTEMWEPDGAATVYLACPAGAGATLRLADHAPPLGDRLRCVALPRA
jgi:hypothetical protein